jgi:hypothetical protein
MTMIEYPTCLALLTCQQVIEQDGLKTIRGLCGEVTPRRLPARIPLVLFAQLTGGQGIGQVVFNVERASDLESVGTVSGRSEYTGAPDRVDNIMPPQLVFSAEEPGLYWIQLLIDGTLISQRRFAVNPPQQSGQQE